MLSSGMLVLFMFMGFINLLNANDTRTIMRNPWYPYAFIGSIIAFVEGGLFAYFTFELMQESINSIDDNQSFIDQEKK